MAVRPNTARITQYFGNNPSYYSQFGLKGHEGEDYGAYYQPTYAVRAGWAAVVSVNYGNYGQCVIIRRPDNTAEIKAHLSRILVSPGQWVNEGQQIGVTGNTGNSSGPHEHNGYQPEYLQNLSNGYWGCQDPEIQFTGASMPTDQQYNDLKAERDTYAEAWAAEKYFHMRGPKGSTRTENRLRIDKPWQVANAEIEREPEWQNNQANPWWQTGDLSSIKQRIKDFIDSL